MANPDVGAIGGWKHVFGVDVNMSWGDNLEG